VTKAQFVNVFCHFDLRRNLIEVTKAQFVNEAKYVISTEHRHKLSPSSKEFFCHFDLRSFKFFCHFDLRRNLIEVTKAQFVIEAKYIIYYLSVNNG